MKEKAKIILLADSINSEGKKLTEVARTIHHITPVCGLEVGIFQYYKRCYCVRAKGSYVWYETHHDFRALKAMKNVWLRKNL